MKQILIAEEESMYQYPSKGVAAFIKQLTPPIPSITLARLEEIGGSIDLDAVWNPTQRREHATKEAFRLEWRMQFSEGLAVLYCVVRGYFHSNEGKYLSRGDEAALLGTSGTTRITVDLPPMVEVPVPFSPLGETCLMFPEEFEEYLETLQNIQEILEQPKEV